MSSFDYNTDVNLMNDNEDDYHLNRKLYDTKLPFA